MRSQRLSISDREGSHACSESVLNASTFKCFVAMPTIQEIALASGK